MEFGKLADVDHIQWNTPQCDPASLAALNPRNQFFELRFGAPAWVNKKWFGEIYPSQIKSNLYLTYYSRSFSTIELNSSHYHIPTNEQCQKWIEQTPAEFRFCPKIYQEISYRPGGMKNVQLIQQWLRFCETLQPRLGLCFIQLPPTFSYENKFYLFSFLKEWPNNFKLAVEFRHPSWFEGQPEKRTIKASVRDYFQSRGLSLIVTDVAGRRDVLHGSVTGNCFVLRFNGYLHLSDSVRSQFWAKRIQELQAQGLNEAYIFIHQPNDERIPTLTKIFLSQINELCQTRYELHEIKKAPIQGALF